MTWWRGHKGEWYVVIQLLILVGVVFVPTHAAGCPIWPAGVARLGTGLGLLAMGLGGVSLLWGMWQLGSSLTPLPYPREQGTFKDTGPYRWVRHPIYSGVVLLSLGWAGWVHGCLTLVAAVGVFGFFDIKARREEQWLLAKYPDYAVYRKRVKKFIPGIY